ncbi:pirin family protein [Streptomyces sp. NPDC050674]|uniref:pirin family protein n=1 Tax=Streptomyces sp. NPDC050674 TaxID=3157216 RepID=UPI00343EB4A5
MSPTRGRGVAPCPHTGRQAVRRLFNGQAEHRDSLGGNAFAWPVELRLMTDGQVYCS